jgi:hypothetical protein
VVVRRHDDVSDADAVAAVDAAVAALACATSTVSVAEGQSFWDMTTIPRDALYVLLGSWWAGTCHDDDEDYEYHVGCEMTKADAMRPFASAM